MIELQGEYNTAVVFTDTLEEKAKQQIENLLNQQFVADSTIRIMPDVHAGAGCTIGTTMTITDKVVPNLVGVDIGCGMETVLLKNSHVELQKLDKVIHSVIPAGFNIRETAHALTEELELENLRCAKYVNVQRARLSLGTLGGGNHFIELNQDEEGKLYLVVHSGSRNLGKQVAEYYQKQAAKAMLKESREIKSMIESLKKQGLQHQIEEKLKEMKPAVVDKNLAYVQGQLFEDYLNDMKIVQQYAVLNRHAMVKEIARNMKLKIEDQMTTIHNYIDLDSMVLRKGAVSAKAGEHLLIPMNMRDGSLLCKGKGNAQWNQSAPHGAGRLMSRRAAKEQFTVSQFKEAMQGIYSTTINKETLDEAPFAYKPIREIMANIGDTVDVISVLKPLYNFKAAE